MRGWLSPLGMYYGSEFTSRALDAWAYWNHVQLDFSRLGKPVDNTFIEALNGSLRRECLSQHWFSSIAEAQHILDVWRRDYNTERPHSSLGHRYPLLRD
jgi:putative transposase